MEPQETSSKLPKIIFEMTALMADQYYSRSHLTNPKTDRHGWANHALMAIAALERGEPRNALYFMVDLLDRILTTEMWNIPKRQEAAALESYMPPLRRIGRDCYTLADSENVSVHIPKGDRPVDVVIIQQGDTVSIGVWSAGAEVGERTLIQSIELNGGVSSDPGATR